MVSKDVVFGELRRWNLKLSLDNGYNCIAIDYEEIEIKDSPKFGSSTCKNIALS